MDRRTFESPMDWEYQNTGPVDLTSPFTQVAKRKTENLFSSPSKPGGHSNAFATFGTPSKPPQTSAFTPQLSSRSIAPPFRNPAFTTPRKIDDLMLSEAEDSPALTETSDFPNDTPEADRMCDVTMAAPTTPSKIDKVSRYGKSSFSKKHVSGKGEIRALRDSSRMEIHALRKRKRHNYDKDVSSVARYMPQEWEEGESDSDENDDQYGRPQSRKRQANGWFGSILKAMEQHPNAPDNLSRWFRLGVNLFVLSVLTFFGWSIVEAVRSDIRNANEKAHTEIMSQITECQTNYKINGCQDNDRPALERMCSEWFECMTQNPESIMRVKVTAKQIAEIINEFAETMNLKAWGFFMAVLVFCLFANTVGRRSGGETPHHPMQSHQAVPPHMQSMAPDGTPAHMWPRFQTPRVQRHAFVDDEGTDTDTSPAKLKPMLPPYTPSGRRSPSKGDRSLSPIKYRRSPSKGY